MIARYSRQDVEKQIFDLEGVQARLPVEFAGANLAYGNMFKAPMSDEATVDDLKERLEVYLIATGYAPE